MLCVMVPFVSCSSLNSAYHKLITAVFLIVLSADHLSVPCIRLCPCDPQHLPFHPHHVSDIVSLWL